MTGIEFYLNSNTLSCMLLLFMKKIFVALVVDPPLLARHLPVRHLLAQRAPRVLPHPLPPALLLPLRPPRLLPQLLPQRPLKAAA